MPQLTDTFFRQGPQESLAAIPRHGDGPAGVRFIHILNPYKGWDVEREQAVQALTFETIRMAAKLAAPAVEVDCVCVTCAGEGDLVPADFIAAKPLTRTVLDVAKFDKPRPLPLVFDIFDHGIAAAPPEVPGYEDYIVFTNTDIHLQPHFYLAMLEFVRSGYDVIDVHRRTILDCAPSARELPFMFDDYGTTHGGTDCLVFPRRMYPFFVKNKACIGRSWVMRGMVFNCAMHARRYLVLTSARLTFHIGNDRAWANPEFADYTSFNAEEAKRVVRAIAADKKGAEKLIGYLYAFTAWQGSAAQGEYVRTAQEAAGLPRRRLPLQQYLALKFKGLRRRLAKKFVRILSPWTY